MSSLRELQEFASALHQARVAGRDCGRVLHDVVGPLLMGMALRLQVLKMDHPEITQVAEEMLASLDQAMERVRALSQSFLLSPVHGLGFEGAVRQLISNRQTGFSGDLALKYSLASRVDSSLAPPLYDALEHMLDEALQRRSVMRIQVTISGTKRVTIRVQDDGKPTGDKPHGMARLLGEAAGIRVSHLPGKGTIILIHGIPRPARG
jgi:signal transduction histidine kinase